MRKELSNGLCMEVRDNSVAILGVEIQFFPSEEEAYDYFDSFNSAEEDEWYEEIVELNKKRST